MFERILMTAIGATLLTKVDLAQAMEVLIQVPGQLQLVNDVLANGGI